MNRSEQIIVEAFEESSAAARADVLAYAQAQDGIAQVNQAYSSLLAKGIIAEDDYGVVTFSRKRAEEYDVLYPLVEDVEEERPTIW